MGLVGAAIGLVSAGALASLVILTDTSVGNALGAPIWMLLYPLSALIGYDLATKGGDAGDGPLLWLGGYSIAVAAAHLAMAAGVAVCVAAGIEGQSPLWYVAFAMCVTATVPARIAAVRLGREFYVSPWALMAASFVILLLAWIAFFITMSFYLERIDS